MAVNANQAEPRVGISTLCLQGLSVAEVASELSGELTVEVPHSNAEMDSGRLIESAADDELGIGLNDDR